MFTTNFLHCSESYSRFSCNIQILWFPAVQATVAEATGYFSSFPNGCYTERRE